MNHQCKSFGCDQPTTNTSSDFCTSCEYVHAISGPDRRIDPDREADIKIDLDVYAVHHMFNLQDPSGCLQQAGRIILLSGIKNDNNGKPTIADIEEARDMLNRWLELNAFAI